MVRVPEAFRLLYAKRQTVIKPGLSRVKAACEILTDAKTGMPLHRATPAIIVAGTNGKGSTSGYLWRLLAAATKRRIGLFSSPHLLSFSERIQVAGQMVDDERIERDLARLMAALPPELWDAMTFFELTTVLALMIFREEQCLVNVLEVGLGGRLDSTNICDAQIAAIVSIGMDHMQFLGPDLSAIAREKAGVMRPGMPVVWGGSNDPTVNQAITTAAREVGAPMVSPLSFDFIASLGLAPQDVVDSPQYLRNNYAIAATIFMTWAESQMYPPKDLLRLAVDAWNSPELPWPPTLWGRFQTFAQPCPLLLDVCHNVDGALAFANAVSEKYLGQGSVERLPGLVSIMRDKDVPGILAVLRRVLDPIVLFKNENERSLSAATLTRDGVTTAPSVADSFDEAWQFALSNFPKATEHSPWVVCGSVMAVGEVLEYFSSRKMLDFDLERGLPHRRHESNSSRPRS